MSSLRLRDDGRLNGFLSPFSAPRTRLPQGEFFEAARSTVLLNRASSLLPGRFQTEVRCRVRLCRDRGMSVQKCVPMRGTRGMSKAAYFSRADRLWPAPAACRGSLRWSGPGAAQRRQRNARACPASGSCCALSSAIEERGRGLDPPVGNGAFTRSRRRKAGKHLRR